MKLLHIVPAYGPNGSEGLGGIQMYVRRIVALQRSAGHEVHVLSGAPEGQPQTSIERELVDAHTLWRLRRDDDRLEHFTRGWHGRASELFERLLDDERFDLVHLHSWIRLSSDLIALAAKREIATVLTLHDYLVSCPRCYRMDAEGKVCTRAFDLAGCALCVPNQDQLDSSALQSALGLFARSLQAEFLQSSVVLVATDQLAERIALYTGLPRERMTTLPLFGEHSTDTEPVALEPEPGEPLRFATWGQQSAHKGTLMLTRAFVRARSESQADQSKLDAELHVFGECLPAEYASEVRRAAGDHPIHFHGAFEFDDIANRGPHVAVFASHCLETHGRVVDEARALGLPLVVPRVGALAERGGQAAFTYQPDDEADLAHVINQVARDPDRRRAAARAEWTPPPDPIEHVRELDRMYQLALATGVRPAPEIAPTSEQWKNMQSGPGKRSDVR